MAQRIYGKQWIQAIRSRTEKIKAEFKGIFSRRTLFLLLLLSLSLVLFVLFYGTLRLADTDTPTVITERDKVTLFLAKETESLTRKTVSVRTGMPEAEKAWFIIAELKRRKSLPEALSLRDFAIGEEGVIYLNLSGTLRADNPEPIRELLSVYGIVNSFLVNFTEAKKVQILFEGTPSVTIDGLLYTHMPMAFNKDVLED